MSNCKVASLTALALVAAMPSWAQKITVAPSHPNGVYASGEKITWNIKVTDDATGAIKTVHYTIKKAGGTDLTQGDVTLTDGAGVIETTQTEPLAYLAEVSAPGTDGKPIRVYGGAVVDPRKIQPAAPRPADFDAFWKSKITDLDKIPINPVVESADSEKTNVDYYKVTLDNVGGTKVRTQLARPKTGDKFPAILLLQYAGVYGLPKTNVTNYAAQGWLAINVMAHDLPFDQAPEFYKAQDSGALKNYVAIGNKSRDTSYFLRMVLACYRASEYLMSRPDWDGKILVASGTSQGGFQSIALTALQPKITAMMVNVPAGSDTLAGTVGRGTSWPYWYNYQSNNGTDKAVLETSRYFDNANFASRIKVPSLVGLGLVDQTSTPTGVFAVANQITGPKEIVVMPFSDHQGRGGTQALYYQRSGPWLDALRKGTTIPLKTDL